MVAHSMELDELLFSSFFMDHGNNNEIKETSSNIKVISFKLPSTTDVNQKVYNATDLTNYFILGWCVHKTDQVSSVWIWNPEHVSQLYIDSDGVFVTVVSSYVFGQECKVVLHRI